jgi:hypothetical protein
MDGLIDDAEGRDLAKHLGCTNFMETSAKQPINVDEVFYSLVREIKKSAKVHRFISRGWILREADVWFAR